ncbi:MAG: polyprenyl synthetase family protein [Bacteroidota bacterium]|nr:polyprenyl synthetase family protein [Bacteroidota bacterium]
MSTTTDIIAEAPTPARKITLQDIRRPVEGELASFKSYFRDAMRNRVFLLDQVVQYLLRQKGKQLRPILVLVTARAAGGVTESSYRAAALVELLHTATLVHDDVVDEADRRRGMFSINALWKNKVAVLLGDFLLSRGLLLALDHKEYQLLHIVSDAVRRMSEGELLQIEKARKLDIDEETYFSIISDKTASLLAACTRCGAHSAGADQEVVDRMGAFGQDLGMAFQIRDDLFDFGVKDVGKPLGIDLQEKKMTLPLIHALAKADGAERKRIMKIVRQKSKSKEDVETVAGFVHEKGGIEYARTTMHAHAEKAIQHLHTLPETEARQALKDLVRFTITREK